MTPSGKRSQNIMSSRFDAAIALIDDANAEDPNMISSDGVERPAELVYSQRMSNMLSRIYPQASEELQLAARAQHLKRWTLPRSDFEMDRKGYNAWRSAAKIKHAEDAAEILASAGYEAQEIERVQSLIRKLRVKHDEEAQAVEDVACLVFLEHYFSAFAAKHDEEKLIRILRKTWVKMSGKAHDAALQLPLDKASAALIERALAD
jgi:Domain of unknown function (DUF4202)